MWYAIFLNIYNYPEWQMYNGKSLIYLTLRNKQLVAQIK